MMVGIHTDLRCTLTAPSLTGTPSLTRILLVNFVSNLDCAFSLICQRQDDIGLINGQSSQFGVQNFRMAHMTLGHAQTNYHVSQFGHLN